MNRTILITAMIHVTAGLLFGCADIPIQETAVPEAGGGFTTCTQRGMGVVSYWVGKIKYDQCVKDAGGMGGDVARLAGQPLDAVIEKIGYPNGNSERVGTDSVYVWSKDGCEIKAGVAKDGVISHAQYDGDSGDCKTFRSALEQQCPCGKAAKGMGGDVARLVGQPLNAVIQKLGYPSSKMSEMIGTDTVYVWEKNDCSVKAGVNSNDVVTHADFEGDRSDCKAYRLALEHP